MGNLLLWTLELLSVARSCGGGVVVLDCTSHEGILVTLSPLLCPSAHDQ